MYLDNVLPAFINHQLALCYLLLCIETDEKTPQILESCADSPPPYKGVSSGEWWLPKRKQVSEGAGVEGSRREKTRAPKNRNISILKSFLFSG